MKITTKTITKFNKNKNKDLYREIFIKNFPNITCRTCKDVIYYYDSAFFLSRDQVLNLKGKSIETKKILNDEEYSLSICEDCLTAMYPEYQQKNKSRVFNQMNYLTEYAFNIPKEISLNWMKEKYAITEENLIKKWGEENGIKKWNEYKNKQAISNSFEYKKEKHGWSKEEYDKFNKSRSVTLNNLTNKHGDEIGLEMWSKYCERQRYTTSSEYFIEKYGKIEGLEKYDNFCKKRMFEFGYSDVSQNLFIELDKRLSAINSQYATKGGEKEFKYIKDGLESTYYLDYYLPEFKIGLEFNGDLWHANPTIFESTEQPFLGFGKEYTANDIWIKDDIKNKFLRTKLNKLIIIWERI